MVALGIDASNMITFGPKFGFVCEKAFRKINTMGKVTILVI